MRMRSKESITSRPGIWVTFQRPAVLLKAVLGFLQHPVHPASLAVFRILYALIIIMQLLRWWTLFDELQESYIRLPYAGWGWVPTLSPFGGKVVLTLGMLFALLVMVGWSTRWNSIGLWVCFGWLFLTCESYFNNHYLLMCHILLAGVIVRWDRWLSLDAYMARPRGKGKDAAPLQIPYWNLMMMQALFFIPYFYGGIAKLNPDWLFRAQPVTMWFQPRGGIYATWWFPWIICWGGCLFDLTIGFFLLWKRTRYFIGLPGILFFNTSNKIMLNIGVFPLLMMFSFVLFVDPHDPAVLLNWLLSRAPPIVPSPSSPGALQRHSSEDIDEPEPTGSGIGASTPRAGDLGQEQAVLRPQAAAGAGGWAANGGMEAQQVRLTMLPSSGSAGKLKSPRGDSPRPWPRSPPGTMPRWMVLLVVGSFVAFHFLYPLRHFVLFKEDPSWTEEGHLGAWHMKLRSKRGWIYIIAKEKSGAVTELEPALDGDLLHRQLRKIESRPHALTVYLRRINQMFDAAGRPLESLHIKACMALNARVPKELFIDSADMLEHMHRYEGLLTSAVNTWMWPWKEAPLCDPALAPHKRADTARQIREAYKTLKQQAGLRVGGWQGQHQRVVLYQPPGEAQPRAAYTWPLP